MGSRHIMDLFDVLFLYPSESAESPTSHLGVLCFSARGAHHGPGSATLWQGAKKNPSVSSGGMVLITVVRLCVRLSHMDGETGCLRHRRTDLWIEDSLVQLVRVGSSNLAKLLETRHQSGQHPPPVG